MYSAAVELKAVVLSSAELFSAPAFDTDGDTDDDEESDGPGRAFKDNDDNDDDIVCMLRICNVDEAFGNVVVDVDENAFTRNRTSGAVDDSSNAAPRTRVAVAGFNDSGFIVEILDLCSNGA